MLDSSEGDTEERWHTIDAELAAYGAGLDERPQVIVLNKTDLQPEPPEFAIEDARIIRTFRVSAATGAGIDELKRALFELVPPEEVIPVFPPRAGARRLSRVPAAAVAARVSRVPHRARLSRHRLPPAPDELERILKGAGAREGTRSSSATTRCSSGADTLRIALFGGAFDPPHVGHVAVARARKEQFDVERLIVFVADAPGTSVELPVEARLELARAAFPDDDVQLDPYPRTIDLLRAESFDEPLFVSAPTSSAASSRGRSPTPSSSWRGSRSRRGRGFRASSSTRCSSNSHGRTASSSSTSSRIRRPRDLRELAAGAPLTGLVPDAVWQLIRATCGALTAATRDTLLRPREGH